MNSEIASTNSLLETLQVFDSITKKFCKLEDLRELKVAIQWVPQAELGLTQFYEESKIRMLKLSRFAGFGDKFSITNLYESLKEDASKMMHIDKITENNDSEEEFHLEKVVLSVANELNDRIVMDDTATSVIIRSDNASQKVFKRKRSSLSRSAKEFLEKAFEVQPNPNRKDRELIAKKCDLTPVQVRVWFTNKRMRSK